MTEQEWLTCPYLVSLLDFLGPKASQRKLRLFAVACCSWVAPLGTDARLLKSIAVAERFADGAATADELSDAQQASQKVYQETAQALDLAELRADLAGTEPGDDRALTALYAAHTVRQTTAARVGGNDFAYNVRYLATVYIQSDPVIWLRDIFGNPFRAAPADPAWLTSTVNALAGQMYDSRDFSPMPILADALQDAGCDDDDILNHCRQPGVHVRGCWLVDLLLGKT